MPAWKDRLKEEEIWSTVGYIQSLATSSGDTAPAVSAGPPREEKFTGSPAAARGKELFFESNRCASCHSEDELSHVPAEKVIPAIEATASNRVKNVKLKDGESFPALVGAEEGGFVRVFDLTEPPPVNRTLEKGEIDSISAGNWSHKAALPNYTAEQLADIVAYIEKK